MKELRIVFMGTPDFAVGILEKLKDEGKNIVGVITAPDKPSGRGRKVSSSAVKEYAVSENLKVLQPTNLKNEDFLEELKSLQANLQIVVAFRMLPKVVWAMPEYGTFNLHASLLPQYRGAAPINWAIINQERTTGVTTFFIDEKIDTGEIIDRAEITISENETAGTLHDKLMELGSELVLKTVSLIEKGKVIPKPQMETQTLKEAPKLTPNNTEINWHQNAEKINAFICGLSPYPVSWTSLINNGENLKAKIYSSSFTIEKHQLDVGTIISSKKELKVASQDGFIMVEEMQLPGKRKMDIISLLNGFNFSEDSKMV